MRASGWTPPAAAAYPGGMDPPPRALPLPLPDPAALLAAAEARLRQRPAYARPLAGRAGRTLESGLAAARAALAGVLRPGAVWRPVTAGITPAGVTLADVPVSAPRLAEALAAGGSALVWLCTTGHDAGELRAALGSERMLVHLAGDLAVEALFAAARAGRAALAAAHPGQRLVHAALRAPGAARWDAAAPARLLPLLGPAPLGVCAGAAGGLTPAHSLLGVAALLPRGAEAGPRGGVSPPPGG